MTVAAWVKALLLASSAASLAPAVRQQTHSYIQTIIESSSDAPSNIPLIIWHGLGDSYANDGQKSVAGLYQKLYPGAGVYRIALGTDGSSDSRASWFGNVGDQITEVCKSLVNHTELASAKYVNALGFSQGGQFLRGLVQTCPEPRVRSLVTFGSQHNGIARYQTCKSGDTLCRWFNGLAQANTWSEWTQSNIVPAQYYRDPEHLDDYLANSGWLAEMNNELVLKKKEYAHNLGQLTRFVMYLFDDDTVVYPPVSGWFAEYNATSDVTTPLRERQLYKEDWLGLQRLDKAGALFFETTPGGHMQLDDAVLETAMREHMSPNLVNDQARSTQLNSNHDSL